jgi:hypothetical protein
MLVRLCTKLVQIASRPPLGLTRQHEIRPSPERRYSADAESIRRHWRIEVFISIVDVYLRADVEHDAVAASVWVGREGVCCEPVSKDLPLVVLFSKC